MQKPTLHITPVSSPASSMTLATPPKTPLDGYSRSSDWSALQRRFEARDTERRNAVLSIPHEVDGEYYEEPDGVLGMGAWSRVMKGFLKSRGRSTVVAIKKPCNHEARKILEDEAKILSYLCRTNPGNSIADYYGFDAITSALVLEYVGGMTLAQYSRQMRSKVGSIGGDPVIGASEWMECTRQLVDTLAHLKTVGVVHGDVTWNNVLVRSRSPFVPVLIDFSSGHLDIAGFRPQPMNAVTTGFASPELLEAFLRRPATYTLSPPPSPIDGPKDDPCPTPTYSSDLYALAMTLLNAALGNEVYENAGRFVGIYARQGQPLDWARSGDGFRIAGRKSVVSQVLDGCFGRYPEKRLTIEDLQDRVAGFA